jgi:hypothetical protein
MKKITLMTLLALAGISFNASAYNYTVVNKTNQTITVSVTPFSGSTYSWVLAPSGTTIPVSQAAPSSLVVPPGINDIPGTEFGDTKVFQFTGTNSKLCLKIGSVKVNGKAADFTWPGHGDYAMDVVYDAILKGSAPVGIYCGDKTISISQNPDGSFAASEPFDS